MAITYPRDWPAGIPIEKSRINLVHNQSIFESQFTKETQVQSHGGGKGDRWEGVFVTPVLSPAQVRVMTAWVTSLRGREKFFNAFDPASKTAEGGENGLVNGASQTGYSVDVDGFTPNKLIITAGQYFGLEDHLYMSLEDVTTDGTGAASITIEPSLKESPADGATVVMVDSYFKARLSEGYEGMETNAQNTGVFSISFEEVV